MKAFITYQTYRIINNKAYIFLFGRLENQESFVTINYFQPYFFIKTKDLNKAKQLEKLNYENTPLKDIKNNQVTKIILNIPKEVKQLRNTLEENNIQCYEADIRFTNRFLIDKEIQGSLNIEGEYDQEDEVDRVYKEPTLTPTQHNPNLKTLSIDIETDSKAKKIFSISLYTNDFKKVLIITKKSLKNAISCQDEEDLLIKFSEYIKQIDPDIITGWNLIDFDLKVIFNRLKHYNLPTNLGRDNTLCKLKLEKNFFKTSKADFPGRQILDAMNILRSSYIKLQDYRLDTAANTILGERKLIQENKGETIERYFKEQPQKLVDYNLKDAELVIKILEKTDTLNLTIKKSLLTGMPLDRTSATIASLDSLYLKQARKRNIVLPSSTFTERTERLKGAYVKEPTPGIYNHVIILDFKSLYPTIIKTFNIDPITYREKKEKNVIEAPNKAFFTTEIEGVVPSLFDNIWKEREIYKKKKDKTAIFALKTLMASFWGAMASPAYRMYNQNLGNAITSFARYLIQKTEKIIQEKGHEVIYGDTDSIFLVSKANSLEQAKELGKKLEKEINDFYDKYIKEKYNRESKLHLEYEKTYIKFLMPKVRGQEKGAKKRYAGLLNIDGKEKIDFVGLESVRGDWTQLAKEFQLELLDRVFHEKEVVNFTKKLVDDIKKGKHDKKLIYRKSIRKELDAYTKITPQHIKAARKLKKLESNLIEYYLTTDGPEPIQNLKHQIDYEQYIKKQIKPIADSILVFFNKTFDELVTQQTSLFNY